MSHDPSMPPGAPSDDLAGLLGRLRALRLREVRATATLREGAQADDAPPCVTLRGLMGERFRALRCLTGAPRCEGCVEAPRCDFARVIGAAEAGVPGDEPRPFWLRGVAVNDYLAGAVVEVSMVTAGSAGVSFLTASLLEAVERLGTTPARRNAVRAIDDRAQPWPGAPPTTGAWRVTLHSPAVLTGDLARSRENCPAMPALALLVSAGLRRVAALVERFEGAPVGRVKMPSLHAVRVVEGGFTTWSGRRYAKRQGRVVPLEGAVGSVVVAGVDEAAPLLHALAVTNVGKATSMGFGWLSVTPA